MVFLCKGFQETITEKEVFNLSLTVNIQVRYTEIEEEEDETIFVVVENMPEFPGGQAALMKYLSQNIKYPVLAQENGIQEIIT